jgi:MFS family permease
MFSFTTPPGWESLTLPLLVVIHLLAGISAAGVMLCTGNIAIELAPKGKATSYLATNALISGIAATIAPILGGLGADWFARRELMVILKWVSPVAGRNVEVPAMVLQGLDFLFLFSCLLSFYVFHRLALIKEEGEVEEEIVIRELSVLVRRSLRSVSTAAEIYHLFEFPYARLMEFFSPQEPPPHDSDLLKGDIL